MPLTLLSKRVRDEAGILREQFSRGEPFRHVVIDEFLDPAFCRDLAEAFPQFDPERARNEYGAIGQKAVFPALPKLGPAYARFDGLMADREFLEVIGQITSISNLLYDPEYVGGGTHENVNGAELDSHVDFNYHPKERTHRRLNLIVFLNPEWEEDWGGCLELLRDPWATKEEDRKIVVPLLNRAVIFETTEHSWHGFRRIRLPEGKQISRRSIAVYFYTAERAADEIVPEHGTIYYQRPLPERMQAGYSLTAEDVSELQALLTRRDHQMQFLYEREREFKDVIAGIAKSPSFRLGRALTWPARALRGAMK